MDEKVPQQTAEGFAAYGLTKAILHNYTMIAARENPNILISAITPGFVETKMTESFKSNTKLTPEQGTASTRHCLFQKLGGNGWFYGSDCLRSPILVTRDPGTPAYTGVTPSRQAAIDASFAKMDISGCGSIDSVNIKSNYNCQIHPQVVSGQISHDEAIL